MRLAGKRAVVTGGASGFGKGIVSRFVAEGAKVMIADINASAATKLSEELGVNTVSHAVDVSEAASVEQMFEQTLLSFGGVDILINNAGITHLPEDLEKIDEEEFDRIFAVNAKSVFLASKYFIPHMKSIGSGAVLNIASTAGVSPRPRLTWYNSSKGWMITATKSMAVELAPFNIRVNAINPVAGETPLLKSFMGEDTPETRSKFLSTIPLGRFSTPTDIAGAALYLCSDEASMVTGVAMEVDGGRCI